MAPMTRRPRRQLTIAAILLLTQGILMEGLVVVALAVLLGFGIRESVITENALVFVLPYFQDNLYLMMAMSGIFAVLRTTGAIGLLRNRLWGLALSLTNCVITLALMVFLLPAGLLDGLFSGAAIVLILIAWLGHTAEGAKRTIV